MNNKMWYRKTLQYKIKMWFYHLTFSDIKKGIKISISFIIDILAIVLGFLMLFIFPAFFH